MNMIKAKDESDRILLEGLWVAVQEFGSLNYSPGDTRQRRRGSAIPGYGTSSKSRRHELRRHFRVSPAVGHTEPVVKGREFGQIPFFPGLLLGDNGPRATIGLRRDAASRTGISADLR